MDEEQIAINRNTAKQLVLNNMQFQETNLVNLDYHKAFDLVLSIDTLEHIIEDHAVCSRFYQALRDGGHIIVHVPRAEKRRVYRRMIGYQTPGHVRKGYEPAQIAGLLQSCGFHIVAVKGTYDWLESFASETGTLLNSNKYLYGLAFPILFSLAKLNSLTRKIGTNSNYSNAVLVHAVKG